MPYYEDEDEGVSVIILSAVAVWAVWFFFTH